MIIIGWVYDFAAITNLNHQGLEYGCRAFVMVLLYYSITQELPLLQINVKSVGGGEKYWNTNLITSAGKELFKTY